jgi:branched-chain amino acid transport system permease protein
VGGNCRFRRRVALLLLLAAALLGLNASDVLAQTPSSSTSTSTGATTTTTGGEGQPGGERVHGRLVDSKGTASSSDDKPISGVTITVVDDKGKKVGSDETADDGTFAIDLPSEGNYVAELDIKSLPKGITVDPAEATRAFFVTPGQDRTLLFPINPHTRSIKGKLDLFLQALVDGTNFGLIIAMCSVGLSLIYGTTGLVNFSHGELVTLGAILAYWFNRGFGWPLLMAAPLAVMLGALAGYGLDAFFWGPLRRRGTGNIAMMVISIGVALALVNVYQYTFGALTKPYSDYHAQPAWSIGPIDLAPKKAFSTVLSLVVLIAVAVALQRTRTGKAMRAISDNPDLAASSGIDVDRVIRLVWFFGAGLAALGGILFSVSQDVNFEQGTSLLLLLFAAITLGGLGAAYGALVGGFVVGLFVNVSTVFIRTELKNVGALVVLILVLLVRPQGILGQSERVG